MSSIEHVAHMAQPFILPWRRKWSAFDILGIENPETGGVSCVGEVGAGNRCKENLKYERIMLALDYLAILPEYAAERSSDFFQPDMTTLQACLRDLAQLLSCWKHDCDAAKTAEAWRVDISIQNSKDIAEERLHYDILKLLHPCASLPQINYGDMWSTQEIFRWKPPSANPIKRQDTGLAPESLPIEFHNEAHSETIKARAVNCFRHDKLQNRSAFEAPRRDGGKHWASKSLDIILQSSWARYEKQWAAMGELDWDCSSEQLAEALPWPAKRSRQRKDSVVRIVRIREEDVVEFLLYGLNDVCKNSAGFQWRMRNEATRWDPSRMKQRFLWIENCEDIMEVMDTVVKVITRLLRAVSY